MITGKVDKGYAKFFPPNSLPQPAYLRSVLFAGELPFTKTSKNNSGNNLSLFKLLLMLSQFHHITIVSQ